ncbi:MAG: class I SAM-dependent rRNA methyltransferase [Candidatus Omnitrophica bacterium]|nr:class I SAM-dependent rRNA methyltransferase [Candidatus Omnitrophota bacterium]
MKTLRCILKKGREKPLEGRHPWIFSGSLDQIDDGYNAGDLVKVYAADGRFFGTGYLNPRSEIAVRMLAFDESEINPSFFERRIKDALALRGFLFHSPEPQSLTSTRGIKDRQSTAYRILNSEGDFLPGLVADRYGDYLVLQIQTAGMERFRETIVEILQRELPLRGIFERDDSDWREREGLERRVGRLWGEEPPDFVEFNENGFQFIADIHGGQKTGFFLDQRENRKRVSEISSGRRVLNCFSYTGAFSIYAAKGGAQQTVSVDSSREAMATAKVHFEKNELGGENHQFVEADVFDYLRQSRQEFDLIILDPPAFCKNKQQVLQASRGYKDINLQAMKRLAPGGLLFTFSCSTYIDATLFQQILFAAAKDARRELRLLQKTSQPADHPVSIFHPEGEYLKGLLLQAV